MKDHHPIHKRLRGYLRDALVEDVKACSIEGVLYPMYCCKNCRWEWRTAPPDPRDKFQLVRGYGHPIPCAEHADWEEKIEELREHLRDAPPCPE